MTDAEKRKLAEERRGKMPYHLIRLKMRKAGFPIRSERSLKMAFCLFSKEENPTERRKTITD